MYRPCFFQDGMIYNSRALDARAMTAYCALSTRPGNHTWLPRHKQLTYFGASKVLG